MSAGAPHRIAVLGTGRMGAAMVGTLGRAGFELSVWNRDRAKAERVAADAGAHVAAEPREAAAEADVVISSLADDAAVEAVYGRLGLRAGQVALEMSTIGPDTVRRVAERVAEDGAAMLDAPVSGSVSLVETGKLTIMVGGEDAAFEQARPVLEALSATLIRVGPIGSGASMKLAVNALVHGLNQALAESLVLAERAGVDRGIAYDVFASGAAGAPFVQYKRAAYERPEETPVAFSLDLVAKDLELILQLADRVGTRMPQATVNLAEVRSAIGSGLGARDLSALGVHLRSEGPGATPEG